MPNKTDMPLLDEEIVQFKTWLADRYQQFPALDDVVIGTAREIVEQVRAPLALGGPVMAKTDDIMLPIQPVPIRIRVYVPHGIQEPSPALIYMHGGGWMFFSLNTHDRLMREYAERAHMIVVGVDYGLAPEHPFPESIEQVVSVSQWLAAQGAMLGIDGTRLALGGDSAGAQLALSSALLLQQHGYGSAIKALVMNYGALVPFAHYPSYQQFGGEEYVLGAEEMRNFWSHYLAGAEAAQPLANGLMAEFAALPPVSLVIAECDVLADENRLFAEQLAAHDISHEAIIYHGCTHSFIEAISTSHRARQAVEQGAQWLRRWCTIS